MECKNMKCPYYKKVEKTSPFERWLGFKRFNSGCSFGYCKLNVRAKSKKHFTRIVCLLLLFTLFLPALDKVYAAETENEYQYSNVMDECAGISFPRWQIVFEPDYDNTFFDSLKFWKDDDVIEYKSWKIHQMLFDFQLSNIHETEILVGYDVALYDIIFNFTFSSIDGQGNVSDSYFSFIYPLSDKYDGTDYFTYTFDYQVLLSKCENYQQSGYPTVISSVSITLTNRVFNTCGTSVNYDFKYKNGNYSTSVVETITYSLFNTVNGLVPMGYHTSIIDGGDTDYSYMYTLHPNSEEEQNYLLWMQISDIIRNLPKFLMSIITGFITFFIELPSYIAMLIPFLPKYLVTGFVYILYFALLISLFRLIFKG